MYCKYCRLILLIILILPTRSQTVPENGSYPICVIGGGISGLSIAALLQEKGHSVLVFEKEGRVGGKFETYREADEVQVDLCPFFFGSWQRRLLSYINRYNLTRMRFDSNDRVGFDPENNYFNVPPSPSVTQAVITEKAVARYISYRKQYAWQLQPGYLNTTPELYVPILDWLKAHKLEAIEPVFNQMMTVEGYGALDDIATLYALQLVTKELIFKLAISGLTHGAFYILNEGFDTLTKKMAEDVNVSLNKEVSRIIRAPDYQTLFFNGNGNCKERQRCSKTILAFPPILSKLNKILQLSAEESEILGKIKIHKYTSAANYIPPLEHNFYYEAYQLPSMEISPPRGIGEVAALLKQSTKKRQSVYSSYSWIRGSYDSGVTDSDLAIINGKLERFIKNVSEDAVTYYTKTSDYFPHVEKASLEDGFYKKFDSLQGRGGLYYATTLLTFEIMECALQMTEDMVHRFF